MRLIWGNFSLSLACVKNTRFLFIKGVIKQLMFQVPDENATYILEPVTNEEYYQDDQNIMWIQETVEVEQVRMQHKLDRAKLSILMFKIPNLISRPHSRRVTTRCRTW